MLSASENQRLQTNLQAAKVPPSHSLRCCSQLQLSLDFEPSPICKIPKSSSQGMKISPQRLKIRHKDNSYQQNQSSSLSHFNFLPDKIDDQAIISNVKAFKASKQPSYFSTMKKWMERQQLKKLNDEILQAKENQPDSDDKVNNNIINSNIAQHCFNPIGQGTTINVSSDITQNLNKDNSLHNDNTQERCSNFVKTNCKTEKRSFSLSQFFSNTSRLSSDRPLSILEKSMKNKTSSNNLSSSTTGVSGLGNSMNPQTNQTKLILLSTSPSSQASCLSTNRPHSQSLHNLASISYQKFNFPLEPSYSDNMVFPPSRETQLKPIIHTQQGDQIPKFPLQSQMLQKKRNKSNNNIMNSYHVKKSHNSHHPPPLFYPPLHKIVQVPANQMPSTPTSHSANVPTVQTSDFQPQQQRQLTTRLFIKKDEIFIPKVMTRNSSFLKKGTKPFESPSYPAIHKPLKLSSSVSTHLGTVYSPHSFQVSPELQEMQVLPVNSNSIAMNTAISNSQNVFTNQQIVEQVKSNELSLFIKKKENLTDRDQFSNQQIPNGVEDNSGAAQIFYQNRFLGEKQHELLRKKFSQLQNSQQQHQQHNHLVNTNSSLSQKETIFGNKLTGVQKNISKTKNSNSENQEAKFNDSSTNTTTMTNSQKVIQLKKLAICSFTRSTSNKKDKIMNQSDLDKPIQLESANSLKLLFLRYPSPKNDQLQFLIKEFS